MTNEEKVQYWINLSNSDLEVAEAMLRGRYNLYVAFMCHQVVEKILKGYFTKRKEEQPPYTHDLKIIAQRGEFWDELSDNQMDFLESLGPLNIRTRYPDYRNTLANELTFNVCERLFEQTKIFQKWMITKML